MDFSEWSPSHLIIAGLAIATIIGQTIAILARLKTTTERLEKQGELFFHTLNKRIDEVHQQIGEVRTEIADVRTELNQRIGEVRTEIADVRTELNQRIDLMRAELNQQIGECVPKSRMCELN